MLFVIVLMLIFDTAQDEKHIENNHPLNEAMRL